MRNFTYKLPYSTAPAQRRTIVLPAETFVNQYPTKIVVRVESFRINQINFCIGNRTGVLSHFKSDELWELSVRNGSKQTLDEWNKNSVLIYSPDQELKQKNNIFCLNVECVNMGNSTMEPVLNVDVYFS